MGRIEYVKFTSVIFDNIYIYLTYLLQRTQQLNQDTGQSNKNQTTKVIQSHASSAGRVSYQTFHFIFLNFVLKIQIQYFLENECDNTISEKSIKREAFDQCLQEALHI